MNPINKKRILFINTMFTVFQTVIDKFLFFVINILVARYLDTSLFGEYTTSLAYATLFSTFADIGIKSTLVRSISKERQNKDNHIMNAFLLKTILAVIVYAAMSVSLLFMNYSAHVIYLVLIFGFVRIGNEYMNLFYAIYSAQERFIVQSVNNTLFSLALLVSTFIVILLKKGIYAFAFTRLFIVMFFILILAFYTIREIKPRIDWKSMKSFLPQAYHFGLSTIYGNLYQRLNIIILSYMHGTIYSGFFSNAYMIFSTLFFIPGNMSRVLIAHLYNYDHEKYPGKFQFSYDVYTKFLDIISIGISLPMFLFSSEIIELIYGRNYLPAAGILKITVLAIPMLFNISGMLLTSIDKQDIRTRCQKYALIINIISNLVLIKFFGGEGAAYATVITYFFLNQSYNLSMLKYLKIKFISSIKNKCFILSIAIVLGSFEHFSPLPFNFIISSCILGLLYSILIYILIITKKDLDIAREVFGKIVPNKKYIFFG